MTCCTLWCNVFFSIFLIYLFKVFWWKVSFDTPALFYALLGFFAWFFGMAVGTQDLHVFHVVGTTKCQRYNVIHLCRKGKQFFTGFAFPFLDIIVFIVNYLNKFIQQSQQARNTILPVPLPVPTASHMSRACVSCVAGRSRTLHTYNQHISTSFWYWSLHRRLTVVPRNWSRFCTKSHFCIFCRHAWFLNDATAADKTARLACPPVAHRPSWA